MAKHFLQDNYPLLMYRTNIQAQLGVVLIGCLQKVMSTHNYCQMHGIMFFFRSFWTVLDSKLFLSQQRKKRKKARIGNLINRDAV